LKLSRKSNLCQNSTRVTGPSPDWKLLLHVVNHATLHRGQIMGMLRQLGKQPPTNDIFIGYHLAHP